MGNGLMVNLIYFFKLRLFVKIFIVNEIGF